MIKVLEKPARQKRGRPPGTGGVQYWSRTASDWQSRAVTAEEQVSILQRQIAADSETIASLKSRTSSLAVAFIQTVKALSTVDQA